MNFRTILRYVQKLNSFLPLKSMELLDMVIVEIMLTDVLNNYFFISELNIFILRKLISNSR